MAHVVTVVTVVPVVLVLLEAARRGARRGARVRMEKEAEEETERETAGRRLRHHSMLPLDLGVEDKVGAGERRERGGRQCRYRRHWRRFVGWCRGCRSASWKTYR